MITNAPAQLRKKGNGEDAKAQSEYTVLTSGGCAAHTDGSGKCLLHYGKT